MNPSFLRILLLIVCGGLVLGCKSSAGSTPAQLARGFQESFEDVPEFGGQVYVLQAGPKDAPPLVLVHGLGQNAARDFEPILPALSHRYRVLAFDLPGFGRSPRPGKAYSPEDYARFVHHMVLRHFEGPVAVLGHSMGGAIAILFASTYPEDVRHLALLDVAGILNYREYTRAVVAAKLSRRGHILDPLRRAAHALFKVGSGPLRGTSLEELELEQTSGLLFIQYDFGPALRSVRAPTWIGWGQLDEIAPLRTLEALRFMLRPSGYSLYAQSGHVPMRSEPEQVVQELSAFLDSAPQRPSVAADRLAFTRIGSCKKERGQVFEGDYDRIELESCRNAVLRNVRARSLQLKHSTATLSHVELLQGDVGLSVLHSRVAWTGGHIESDICIDTARSRLNLVGVECLFGSQAIRVRDRSRVMASVSGYQRDGERTPLHGEYSLPRNVTR